MAQSVSRQPEYVAHIADRLSVAAQEAPRELRSLIDRTWDMADHDLPHLISCARFGTFFASLHEDFSVRMLFRISNSCNRELGMLFRGNTTNDTCDRDTFFRASRLNVGADTNSAGVACFSLRSSLLVVRRIVVLFVCRGVYRGVRGEARVRSHRQ